MSGRVDVKFKRKYKQNGNKVSLEINGKKYYCNSKTNCITANVANPKLWNCNGFGKPNLYKAVLRVENGDHTVWEKAYNVGFRNVEFIRNENSSDKCLPYTLILNGERVYVKGFNFVPIEMSQAHATKNKYEKLIKQVKECNANLIRVWGGGIIETEEFYSLCDKHGIMVWQDFTQSSSAIDNQATVKLDGLKRLKETAICATKRLRNHPSHILYCGGNELMDSFYKPHGFDNKNIALLKSIVDKYDEGKFMLPTTASGHNAGPSIASVGKDENDDIHGPWTMFSFDEYCDVYNKLDSKFHSEFGVDGYCNISAHNKMFSKKRRKYKKMQDDFCRLIKGEWWNSEGRDEFLFGKIDDLEAASYLSQFIQAEGIRYAIEANRRRAFQNSGCIVWQLNEPFPNLICTNVVDYFCKPKLAYYLAKQAYSPVNMNLKYQKFYAENNSDFLADVYLTSDYQGDFHCYISVFGDEDKILEEEYKCRINEKGKSVLLKNLNVMVKDFDVLNFTMRVKFNGNESVSEVCIPVMRDGVCNREPIIDYCKRRMQ
jgi:beta-mannosidase